jgi:hypothetical protein
MITLKFSTVYSLCSAPVPPYRPSPSHHLVRIQPRSLSCMRPVLSCFTSSSDSGLPFIALGSSLLSPASFIVHALTLHGVSLDVLPCRQIVRIAVVIHTGDTCTSAKVLRRTGITLPVELWERVDSEIYYHSRGRSLICPWTRALMSVEQY